MERLIINTMREAYSTEDVRRTMTVGELKGFLEDFDEDTEIMLSFDNGYTFGGITESRIYLEGDEDWE